MSTRFRDARLRQEQRVKNSFQTNPFFNRVLETRVFESAMAAGNEEKNLKSSALGVSFRRDCAIVNKT